MPFFDGFRRGRADCNGVGINYVTAGSGPPLLLLHGHPQSLTMWHRVAPALAERYTVVCADLRGYGDSDRPPDGENHIGYAKRTMATDMVALMRGLGHARFGLVAHDRGARVGQRLCLDHPDAVTAFVPIDISPTLTIYEGTNQELATRYFHWFFLIQPADFPERLISHDIDYYIPWMLGHRWRRPIVHHPDAVSEYVRCAKLPGAIHAMCEDYRAAATIDLEHDRADRGRRKICCPVHALWAREGVIDRLFDPVHDFAEWSHGQVTGTPLPGGHYLAEEVPDLVLREVIAFLERCGQ